MPEEEKQAAAALEEALARAFRRLDMTFESPEAYLDFWFPDRGLTMDDLPPDLADYYLYDLGEVEGGYRPKASRAAAEEDSPSVSESGPTAEEMRRVVCPVALIRASQGFFPGSDPLISAEARDTIAGSLGVREEMLLEGANHYTKTTTLCCGLSTQVYGPIRFSIRLSGSGERELELVFVD
jgi:lipase